MKAFRICISLALAFALAASAAAAPKKPRPKPPPPPPDTAADCSFTAEAVVPDYIVLAMIDLTVQCATVKQSITVKATSFTRDGVALPLIPFDLRTCAGASACSFVIDLFSYDTSSFPAPGDQRYCATGFGLVGGTTLGPRSTCEDDTRL
jgi:hypothetical protein